ncbi:hypothetical protein ACLKA7_001027 [Drosophila subpalustris]
MDLVRQNSLTEIKKRGQYLLHSEKWADCRFLVGTPPNQRIICGHKLLLAMASPVLERMFFGQLPDLTDPIIIPDVHPEAFEAMLEYIYTDRITIGSFDKACELCYVAKKFMLPHADMTGQQIKMEPDVAAMVRHMHQDVDVDNFEQQLPANASGNSHSPASSSALTSLVAPPARPRRPM